MLKKISPLLTGDLLKILCDMGHGDEIVISDANFPAETIGQRVIRCPGINVSDFLEAALPLFPLDSYSAHPAAVMALTEGDRQKGMPRPVVWDDYYRLLMPYCPGQPSGQDDVFEYVERFAFYERAKKAYAVIQTGEARQYGNLLLVKGIV